MGRSLAEASNYQNMLHILQLKYFELESVIYDLRGRAVSRHHVIMDGKSMQRTFSQQT